MPDTPPLHAFIWYHANRDQAPLFQQWLLKLKLALQIEGKLYRRQQNDKTTFMERFACVDYATIKKIEQLATQQDCFHGIQRRCESFERISNL